MARRPVCPVRVYGPYNTVADSGDLVIQKQGFSIVDTHEPAIAIPPSICLHAIDSRPHRNQMFLIGRRQGVRRFVSPGLHHITSVNSHSGMSRNERLASTSFVSFLLSSAAIVCHHQALRTAIYWGRYPRAARK